MIPTLTIKLCGLRSEDDAQAAVDAGADELGLVLVPGVRRSVAIDRAQQIAAHARQHSRARQLPPPSVIGIVGGPLTQQDTARILTIGLDAVQLVGDEHAARSLAQALAPTMLTRTISVHDRDPLDAIVLEARRWASDGVRVTFDARCGTALGGTGTRISSQLLHALQRRLDQRICIAGGLDLDNVHEIVAEHDPALVDVSSGIEDGRGENDPALMRAFVQAARSAARRIATSNVGGAS